MSKYRIDWPRTIGAALAAIAVALLLSRLGPIGTISGAALGSVVLSLGTSFFAQGIARTHETVMSRRGTVAIVDADRSAEPVPVASRPVQWKHIWLVAAGLFVASILLITTFELATGRPLSSYVGAGGHGTSIAHLGGGGSTPKVVPTPTATPTPTPSATPTPTPSATPTASPSASAAPTPSASPSAVSSAVASVQP